MKELTKKEIEKIVKESNKDLVGESYTYLANDEVDARKEKLASYSQFVEQAKVLLDQLINRVASDQETGNCSAADIDYLIHDQLQTRMQDALNYTIASLEAAKGPGIKNTDEYPNMVYPNMYDE